MTLLLQFLPAFCFSNEHEQSTNWSIWLPIPMEKAVESCMIEKYSIKHLKIPCFLRVKGLFCIKNTNSERK